MSIDIALEDIAMGEADLPAAARTISSCLRRVDDDVAHELYAALRSWLWKALEARRRDDELLEWLDVIGRVSSHLTPRWHTLSIKLDGFAELLQTSIMVAAAPRRRDLMTRKHVREMLSAIYAAGGRMRRRELAQTLKLKDANLTRVAAPLQDEGWLQRELLGREVFYRLTEKGKASWLPVIAREPRAKARPMPRTPSLFVYHDKVHLTRWKGPKGGREVIADPREYSSFHIPLVGVQIEELGFEDAGDTFMRFDPAVTTRHDDQLVVQVGR